jgi:hypothetical protein
METFARALTSTHVRTCLVLHFTVCCVQSGLFAPVRLRRATRELARDRCLHDDDDGDAAITATRGLATTYDAAFVLPLLALALVVLPAVSRYVHVCVHAVICLQRSTASHSARDDLCVQICCRLCSLVLLLRVLVCAD